MTKAEFTAFIKSEKQQGGVRFAVALNTTGEGFMYWTKGNGVRVSQKLCGVKGKLPTVTTKKLIRQYRSWLKQT
ncbi:hypothetical protein ACOZB2_03990 [Pantoea endophytica]|uniref:Uncharacterized protein n=1 Tax=Pantoea sp. BJ2 TaxID=3141322 RepID=A0AAU7U459_9GAMM